MYQPDYDPYDLDSYDIDDRVRFAAQSLYNAGVDLGCTDTMVLSDLHMALRSFISYDEFDPIVKELEETGFLSADSPNIESHLGTLDIVPSPQPDPEIEQDFDLG